jgi:3',5'-cyclic AMP phosphodiesterase CpdA
MTRRTLLSLPLLGVAAGAPNERHEVVRLGVIADPQYADKETRGSRYYRASRGKLEAAVKRLNEADLNAVVTLGDFIDEDLESFQPVMERYRSLKAPHLKVVGNHDFTMADEDKAKVFEALQMERPYASQIFGNWRIVLLDGTEVSPFRPEQAEQARAWRKELAAAGRKNAQPYNGGLGETQFAWLEKELAAAEKAGQRVVLACHYPVLPEDPHNLWNDREVVALIDRHPCVAAWFNGHHHAGNYARRKHCHYVNFKGMVETADRSAFAIVTLHSDRLVVEGFDTEPDRDLKSPAP